jgi:hypothetical protein
MMTIESLKLTKENTKVVAEKRRGKPKYGWGCTLKSFAYDEYRRERRQSGFFQRDGWMLPSSAEVSSEILRIHGFTEASAILSARAYTASVKGENYGRIPVSGELILPDENDTVETLCAKYLALPCTAEAHNYKS